ncbi:hypothetical protein Xbud_02902 [Xenorhabdus budapestensis]|uniref:Uncharacterized protein n=1 Tax=Xenorhabdus budapestensis TaxID=290110 RepID=A0A2D0IU88_XENBU|nr:hypothetical protein Xbud_02902 [Xenorhabdus budapestensis]
MSLTSSLSLTRRVNGTLLSAAFRANSLADFTAFDVAAWASLLLSTALLKITNPLFFNVASGWLRLSAWSLILSLTYLRVAKPENNSSNEPIKFMLSIGKSIRIVCSCICDLYSSAQFPMATSVPLLSNRPISRIHQLPSSSGSICSITIWLGFLGSMNNLSISARCLSLIN